MKIIIGADLAPTKSNYELFINADMDNLVGCELMNLLQKYDFRVFNLEVPLSDEEDPIPKCGENLVSPTSTCRGIRALGVDLLTLANNHIMDQDLQGLQSTTEVLKENNIQYFGAGKNLSNLKHSFVVEKQGRTVGLYACAEHEFSIATNQKSGANPFSVESLDHIAELKSKCDYVVVLYHGGKEYYRYPSPMLQKTLRKCVDNGADLVIAQHTHCVGCKEKYKSGTIVYGQGNFIFDEQSNEFLDTSLLISIEFEKSNFDVEYIPLCRTDGGVRIADTEESNSILSGFYKRSEEIKNEAVVIAKYDEFAQKMISNYLNSLFGTNVFFRIANKLLGHRLKIKLSEKKRYALINYIECEAHRELFLRGLKSD